MADELAVDGIPAEPDHKRTVLIASIVTAAVVSAATAGYMVWRKTQGSQSVTADNVQDLLDKAHRTLHILEDRLDDLRSTVALTSGPDSGTARA